VKAIVSIFLIFAYLLLPPLCLGNAYDCEGQSATTTYILEACDTGDTDEKDSDECNAACCSEHVPCANTVRHPPVVTVTVAVPPAIYVSPFPRDIFVPPRSR